MHTKSLYTITFLILLYGIAPGQEVTFYGAENGTINNCVGGCTSGDGDCFIISVSGVGTLNNTSNGLTRVCFSITGSRPKDYDIILKAPDGTTATLVNDAGSTSGTYNNGICFTDFGPTDALASWPGTIQEGNYTPTSLFSTTFNSPGTNANGDWTICIRDDNSSGGDGTINYASLTFGQVTPETTPNATTCANAVAITPPFFRSNIDVGASSDNYDSGCSGIISGNDYVLSYTPASDTYLSLTANYDATSNGPSVAIFDGCPDSGPTCVASDKMGTFDTYIRLTAVPLTGGTTYYIVCSSDFSSSSENLDLEVIAGNRGSDDCTTATTISTNEPIMGNNTATIDPNGSQAPNLTTEMGCNGATNNFNYYYFNTSSTGTNVNLDIYDIDCGAGASGLQVSLFQSSTPCITGSWGASLACESSVLSSDTYYNWTGLTASTDYYVIIDGVAGDNCVWKMRMSGGIDLTLPIELVSFDAALNNDRVDLSWITSAEINNDFFTLERSADGKQYQPIGQVSGAGNHSGNLRYSFSDYAPLTGQSYYRLKQTDFDGQFSYSKIRTVNRESHTLTLYPNPASAGDLLVLDKDVLQGTFRIYDATGRTIHEIHNAGKTTQFQLPTDLFPGAYFVSVFSMHNGFHASGKLLIE